MDVALEEREVLSRDWRRECADALERRTPETGQHIDCEGQGDACEQETGHTDFLHLVVVGECDLAEQIDTEQGKYHDPEGYEYLTVENSPSIGEVGHG